MPNGNKWDKYKVSDRWSKYAVTADTTDSQNMVDARSPQAQRIDLTPAPQPPPSFGELALRAIGLPSQEAIGTVQKGIRQIKRGSGLAGGVNIMANAPAEQAFSQIGAFGELANRLSPFIPPENPLVAPGRTLLPVINTVAGLPSKILGGVGSFLGGGLGESLPTQSPSVRQERKEAMGEAGSTAAQLLIPEILGGAKKYVANIPGRAISKGMELFDEALPVASKEFTRAEDLRNMIPYVKEELQKQPVIKGNRENSVVRQTDERVFKNIEDRVYNDRNQLIQPNKDAIIAGGGNEIANTVESLRNKFTQNIDLLSDKSIVTEADKWRSLGNITLGDAAEYLRHINDNLHNLYKKTMAEQVATEGASKPIAELKKAAESIRELIADKLDEVNGSGNYYRKLSEDYGSASVLRFAAERNKVASEKPTPGLLERFSERIGTSGNAYASIRAPILFPKLFGANMKLTRAFDRFIKYGGNIVEPAISTGTIMAPPKLPQISNPTAGLSNAGEIGKIDIRKLALRPEETKLPPLSTIEEDVAGIQNTPGMREMMIRRLGPESVNFTDEQLARAYRAKSSAYLNEATPEEINKLRASGRITQRAATQAINTKTGTANQQTIESLKQQIANKSSEDMMTPKSGTTEDFVAHRKYISSGGNLNFSDWKSSGKPIK